MQTILFVELLGGIGDVLIALPTIQALGRAYPQARLTVLTFAPGSELIKGDRLIHEVIGINPTQNPLPHLARNAVAAVLKRHRFDLIVSDTNYDNIQTLIQGSGTPRVVTNLWRSPPPQQRVGDRFLQILHAEGLITPDNIAPTQLDLTFAERRYVQERLGALTQPLVILYPDAGMAVKRWSTANFVRVGQALQQQYDATLVVPVGSDAEQSAQIAKQIGGTAIVWDRGTLRELTALIATADLVIASDTGAAHIAAAVKTPTITLFGPSWHGRYGQSAPHINLQGYLDCSERNIGNFTMQRCWSNDECPFDRWQTCLEAISPAEVLAAATSLLASSSAPTRLKLDTSSTNVGTPTINAEVSSLNAEASSANAEASNLKLDPSNANAEVSNVNAEASNVNAEASNANAGTSNANAGTSNANAGTSNANAGTSSLNLNPSSTTYPSTVANDEPLPLDAIAANWQSWSSVRNLLVMRLDNIGDVLMTSPALRAIKESIPTTRLTLMASPSGSQAAVLLPWLDEVLVCRALWQDLGKLAFDPDREAALIQTLRDRQFDAAIIFTSFSQTPHPAGFIGYLARIPLRLGQSKEWGGAVLTTEVKAGLDTTHQVERNLHLIETVGFTVHDRSLGIQIPPAAKHSAAAKLLEQGLSPREPYILLNPWTSCQSRNYAADRFAIAAQTLAKKTGYRFVVTGVAGDRAHSDPLLEQLGSSAIDLIGHTSLAELAALIAKAALMLSNNTSTMHLADATRTPSVILFAGTEYESQWQPRHTTARLLRQPTACSPCYAFTCPFNLECLDISPDQVVEAGLALLQISTPIQQPSIPIQQPSIPIQQPSIPAQSQ